MAFDVFTFTVSIDAPAVNPAPPPDGFTWDQLIATDADGDLILPDGIPAGELDAIRTALNRLFKQFESDPDWRNLATVIGEQFKNVDIQQLAITGGRYVSNAIGATLDDIGEIVGRPRGGLTDDDDYRQAIIAEGASLITSGTVPEILEVVAALLGAIPGVVFTEKFPASWALCVPDLTAAEFELLRVILADQPSAGVAAVLCTFDPLVAGARRSSAGSGGGLLGSRRSSAGAGSGTILPLHHHGAAI